MSNHVANNVPNNGNEPPGYWQVRLEAYCAANGFRPPVFHTASDRRGGRTAWSRSVEVNGQVYTARYWYDGNYVQNASEDASELALERLEAVQRMLEQQQQQQWQQQSGTLDSTQTHGQ